MIAVNGREIDERAVAAEMQHHPAPDAEAAHEAAAQALAVRALLNQRAEALGIDDADENVRLDTLLAREVTVPEPDTETCRRYYDSHRAQFRSPTLYEAAHILVAAPPRDRSAYEQATATAKQVIEEMKAHPERFGRLAEAWSACPSKLNGGHLGQVARGDTVPEFDTFLENLEPGQLCPVPVPTRYGVHVDLLPVGPSVIVRVQGFMMPAPGPWR
ncbi:MAG: peptidylprolyl isomerase [Alphaproteobacteria bacterium]